MNDMAGKTPLVASDMPSMELPDLTATQTADPDSESCFVHHRRTQRFLGKETGYSRRPYGRI